MSERNLCVPLAEAARARGELRRVWEGDGAPTLMLAELRDVCFWMGPGIDGVVFLDGDEVVEESLQFFKPVNAPGRALGRRVRRPRPDEVLANFDAVLLPVNPGWMNYFHWLTIHVPSLLAAGEWLDDSVPAVLPRYEDHLAIPRPVSFARAVMDESLAGAKRTLLPLAPGAYRARRMFCFLVDAPQQAEGLHCAPWRAALSALAARLRGAGDAAGPRRLFVSRRGAKRRLLAAEEDPAFRATLQRLEFATPELAGRGLAEQAACFRGARLIAGPHGAGLTNLLFCEPGAAVLEYNAAVSGEADPRSHFRRIAEVCGLRYHERLIGEGCEPTQLAEELERWAEAHA